MNMKVVTVLNFGLYGKSYWHHTLLMHDKYKLM